MRSISKVGYITLLFAIASLAVAQDEKMQCAVTLRVVDMSGLKQPSYALVSFKDRKGRDYAANFQNLRGMVPCTLGQYFYQIRQVGVNLRLSEQTSIDGTLGDADKPETWLTVVAPPVILSAAGDRAVSVNSSRSRSYVWNGKIRGMRKEPLWVSLRLAVPSASSIAYIEAQVDPDGSFRAYGPFYKGTYTLYVTNSAG